MKTIFVFTILFLSTMMVSQEKHTLIYVGDPMCSWCYGISEQMDSLVQATSETLDFKLVMGGLRPYNTETMADLGDFLKHHWEDVHEASGQEFSYEILNDTHFVYDTEPPSRAVLAVRELAPEKQWIFFKRVQQAFYLQNKNTHALETYLPIVEDLGLDPTAFKERFESQELKNKIRLDFQEAGQLGVRSFPTVLLQTGSIVTPIAKGYASFAEMLPRVEKVVSTYDR